MIKRLDDIFKYDIRFLTDVYLKNINLKGIEHEHLYDFYFADHVIKLDLIKGLYNVHLQRNNSLFYYVEENPNYFDKIKELFPMAYRCPLPFYFSWGNNSLLCLNDSWSALGWVDHFLGNRELYKDEEIFLIHFDSHSDMGNPLIARHVNTKDHYYDLLRGSKINTNGILDFFIAIAIGSIGISSYISTLSLFFKKITVFYINQFKNTHKKFNYKIDFKQDNIFETSYPSLYRLQHVYDQDDSKNENEYPHTYFKLASIRDCLSLIPQNKNIYLHFDMDYFNNWLDGSSKKYRSTQNIRTIYEQYDEMDEIVSYLKKIKNNILHTSIGLSPGFFHSEYWVSSTKYLIHSLNNQGISFHIENVFPNFDVY